MKKFLVFMFGLLMVVMAAGRVLAADEYALDKVHSSIGFSVSHLMISKTTGVFNDFSGTIRFDAADLPGSSLDFTVKVDSIDTKNTGRDEHLRGADFFDSKQYPDIRFVSRKIESAGEGLYNVTGDLTMKQVTKEVVIPLRVAGPVLHPMNGKQALGMEANFRVNRQDYGVNWNKTMDNGGVMVGDEVDVSVQIEAQK